MLTLSSVRQASAHIAGQRHAMAGATIAASGALACGLAEACVRINVLHLADAVHQAAAERAAARLADIREQLLGLADEDGAAIATFAALREAGQGLQGQDRLCQMPVEMGHLAAEAASLLQGFRSIVRVVRDDLEMAITLLYGAARAATLLLDANLRIWPVPTLLARYGPELTELREQVESVSVCR